MPAHTTLCNPDNNKLAGPASGLLRGSPRGDVTAQWGLLLFSASRFPIKPAGPCITSEATQPQFDNRSTAETARASSPIGFVEPVSNVLNMQKKEKKKIPTKKNQLTAWHCVSTWSLSVQSIWEMVH